MVEVHCPWTLSFSDIHFRHRLHFGSIIWILIRQTASSRNCIARRSKSLVSSAGPSSSASSDESSWSATWEAGRVLFGVHPKCIRNSLAPENRKKYITPMKKQLCCDIVTLSMKNANPRMLFCFLFFIFTHPPTNSFP